MRLKIYILVIMLAAGIAGISATESRTDSHTRSNVFMKGTMTNPRIYEAPILKNGDSKRTPIYKMERTEPSRKSDILKKTSEMKKNAEKLYNVTCIFEGQDMPYFAIFNTDFYEETKFKVWYEQEETDRYYFQIPEGTYDIVADFWNRSDDPALNTWAKIIHEDVVIDKDMEIRFSTEELTERMAVNPMLKSGKKGHLPEGRYLDQEPWIEIDDTDANISFIHLDYCMFKEGCDIIGSGYAVADYWTSDRGEDVYYMLTNKLSDKYHFVFMYYVVTKNGEVEISLTDSNVKDGETNNNISNFVKYEWPEFGHTPLNEKEGTINYNSCVEGRYWIDNIQIGGGGCYLSDENPTVYFNASPTLSDLIDMKGIVSARQVEVEKVIHIVEDWGDGEVSEYDETIRGDICALPSYYHDGKWEFINQNHSDCGNYSYQKPEEGPIVEYPGHEAYSFFGGQQPQKLGNNTPIMVLMTQVNSYDEGVKIFSFSDQAYIGRYGELRGCDFFTATQKVYLNDEKVFDSNNEENMTLSSWCIKNSTDNHEKGVIRAEFSNNNVEVDGIPGNTLTTVTVDERKDDLCAPTLQMLTFKDADGIITDRFDSSKNGTIEFSAGDFNWVSEDNGWYYTCEEADVKVEYSPYGEDSFNELAVTEIPELYFMPGFGNFYRGSLKDVKESSINGWYDIRFTLRDKSGNEMVQKLSPAFHIGELSALNNVNAESVKVWSSNGAIYVDAPEGSDVTIYTIDGKKICAQPSSYTTGIFPKGIYLVNVKTPEGKTMAAKTIVK